MIGEQIEDFEIDHRVSSNLESDETLLYKLKITVYNWNPKLIKSFPFILIIMVIVALLLGIIRHGLAYFEESTTMVILISPFIVFPVYYFFVRKLNKHFEHFYLTNKKIYIIKEFLSMVGDNVVIKPLNEILGISITKRKPRAKYFQIEIISKNITEYSTISKNNFLVIDNLQEVVKIIESILWIKCNIEERLKSKKQELGIEFPFELHDVNEVDSLVVYSDKTIYRDSYRSLEIPCNLDLNMKFRVWRSKGKMVGFLTINPSYKDKEYIEIKIDEDLLGIMEIIYYQHLSWKSEKGHLFDSKSIENLQPKKIPVMAKHTFDTKILEREEKDRSQEKYRPFQDFIKEQERILFNYLPRIINLRFLIVAFLTIVGFIAIFYPFTQTITEENLSSAKSLIFLGMFPVFMGPCYLLANINKNMSKCIFTTEKMIIKKYNKVGYTSYSNISTITYSNQWRSQHITIKLKEPLKSEQFEDKKSIYIPFIPKKLKFYDKIQSLKIKYMER